MFEFEYTSLLTDTIPDSISDSLRVKAIFSSTALNYNSLAYMSRTARSVHESSAVLCKLSGVFLSSDRSDDKI